MMSGRRVLSRGFAALLSVFLFCGSASASFDDPATRALFRAALRGEPEEIRQAVDEGALKAVTPTWNYPYGKFMEGKMWDGGEEDPDAAVDEADETPPALPAFWGIWIESHGQWDAAGKFHVEIPVELRYGGGESVLAVAVDAAVYQERGLAAVEKLLDLGCEIDRKDARGRTPLMVAAGARSLRSDRLGASVASIEAIELLTRRGVSVDAVDRQGRTALMLAVSAQNGLAGVDALLAAGADPNVRDAKGRSALMTALYDPQTEESVAERLLEAGLKPEALRDPENTALRLAIGREMGLVGKLLDFEWTREELNAALVSPLPGSRLYIDAIRLLLMRGAELDARDAGGRTLLMNGLAPGGWLRDDLDDLPHLLALSPDLGARDYRGRTCLHLSHRAEILNLLLEAGADPDALDRDGRSPLFFMEEPDALALLLSCGVDPNRQDRDGVTPLLAAMRTTSNAQIEQVYGCVALLLDARADVNRAAHDGTTALMKAAQPAAPNDPDCSVWMEALLEKGADPNAKRFDGATPLSLVVRCEPPMAEVDRDEYEPMDIFEWQQEKVELLLSHGADPDEPDLTGRSPRDYAARHKDPRVKELFAKISAGHAIAKERTPLMKAALTAKNTNSLRSLLAKGESLASRDRYGWTPLIFAAWHNPNPDIVKFLVRNGADVNARDRLGTTPLMLAVWRNRKPEYLRALVAAGARVELRDLAGNSAIDVAIARDRSPEVLEFLYNTAVKRFDKSDLGQSMLLSASAVTSDPQVIRMLLKKGVSVDCRDADGQTPLMKATALNPHPEVVKALLDAKANPNAKDNAGVSVLDRALKGDSEVLKLLIAAGVDLEEESVWWAPWEKMMLTPKGGR